MLCWQLAASSADLTLNHITKNRSSESTATAEFQLTPVLCHSVKKIYLWAGCWGCARWYKVTHTRRICRCLRKRLKTPADKCGENRAETDWLIGWALELTCRSDYCHCTKINCQDYTFLLFCRTGSEMLEERGLNWDNGSVQKDTVVQSLTSLVKHWV